MDIKGIFIKDKGNARWNRNSEIIFVFLEAVLYISLSFFICELEALLLYGKSNKILFSRRATDLRQQISMTKMIWMLVKWFRVFVTGCYNSSTLENGTYTELSLFSPPLCQKFCLQKEFYLFAVQVTMGIHNSWKNIIVYAYGIIIFSEIFFFQLEKYMPVPSC